MSSYNEHIRFHEKQPKNTDFRKKEISSQYLNPITKSHLKRKTNDFIKEDNLFKKTINPRRRKNSYKISTAPQTYPQFPEIVKEKIVYYCKVCNLRKESNLFYGIKLLISKCNRCKKNQLHSRNKRNMSKGQAYGFYDE